VCVIKILLIVALRFGNVQGTTIQEVLKHTATRHDRTVQWKHPKWPVICRMENSSSPLTLDKPGPAEQLTITLSQIALAAGLLDRVSSHAIRRGAMRDVAYLKKSVAGVETACAALIAGHSKVAENHGITRDYVGALQVSTYNLRAESNFVDRLAPKIAGSPFDQHRSSTKEVDSYMERHNMEKSDKRKRVTAATHLQKEKIREWEEAERNRRVSVADKPELAGLQVNRAEVGRGKTIFPSRIVKAISDGMASETMVALSEKTPNEINAVQGRLLSGRSDSHAGKDFSRDPHIDPQLLDLDDNLGKDENEVEPAALEALESLVFGFDSGPENGDSAPGTTAAEATLDSHIWDTDAIEDTLVQAHLDETPAHSGMESRPLLFEPDTFVDWFAAINVFRFARNSVTIESRQPVGNSRDVPTPFLFHCGVGACEYQSDRVKSIETHQVYCDGCPPVEKCFSCPEDGCLRTFSTADSLRTHTRSTHEWEPVSCSQCPQDPNTLYHDVNELRRHQDWIHHVFEEPRRCPLPCDNEALYTRYSALRQHLASVHHQTAEQIGVLVPPKTPARSPKSSYDCPIAHCTLKNNATSNIALRNHLIRKHDYTEEQALELVPDSKTAKTKQKRRKEAEPKPPRPRWKCPVNDCKSKRTFRANRDRRTHLQSHKWTADEAMEYVPLSKAEITRAVNRATADVQEPTPAISKSWKCPMKECSYETTVVTNQNRRRHLKTMHSLTDVQMIEYVPLSKAAKTMAPAREEKATKEE
jgi:hypothetical protein